MNRERLLRLADHMERVDPQNYDQGSWLEVEPGAISPAPSEFDHGRLIVREGACGTTMCVLGHAVAAVPDAELWFAGEHFPFWVVIRNRDPHTGLVFEGFRAARHAFDLPEDHAPVLFGGTDEPSTYIFYTGQAYDYDKGENDFRDLVTPTTVAAALRRYVETDGETARLALKIAADLSEEWGAR